MSYGGTFAAWYDRLTGEIDYPKRARYFSRLAHRYMQIDEQTILLDLACGTGSLSVEFCALGYDVIGVDASAEMLSEAMSKGNTQKRILYLCQRVEQLDLYGTIDIAVCALDSLNHITDPQILKKAIERVSLFTVPGGLFLFDVNTEYKHRDILANHTFVYDLDGLYCVWQNSTDSSLLTTISLDFFEQVDGVYYRSEEQFAERAYSDSFLRQTLDEAGYDLLGVFAEDSLEPPASDTQRAVYVAQKR